MSRKKAFISAYACRPGEGSEPGIGWNIVSGMAAHHDVWAVTREKNRDVIEAELARRPVPGLQFVYYDLPHWAAWWRRGHRGVQPYYYLWQLGVYPLARRLHEEIEFDLVHHATFGKYWAPSLMARLDVPFLWGPVGGGESAPRSLRDGLSIRGRLYECVRDVARWLGERDPLVRVTARRSAHALATTHETARCLARLKARSVEVFGAVALNDVEIRRLAALPRPDSERFTFVSMGRLLHWKGFHLGISAFAQAGLEKADYWIIGDGPEFGRLQAQARMLGVEERVRFYDRRSRPETLELLGRSHVLVHPSLHDSGGWVCLEAMAAGRPVLCLDLGGPAIQVTEETGVRISARETHEAVAALAREMRTLASDRTLCATLGDAGRAHASREYLWATKLAQLARTYDSIASGDAEHERKRHPAMIAA